MKSKSLNLDEIKNAQIEIIKASAQKKVKGGTATLESSDGEMRFGVIVEAEPD